MTAVLYECSIEGKRFNNVASQVFALTRVYDVKVKCTCTSVLAIVKRHMNLLMN